MGKESTCDALVAGSGIAAAILACRLATSGYSVCVLHDMKRLDRHMGRMLGPEERQALVTHCRVSMEELEGYALSRGICALWAGELAVIGSGMFSGYKNAWYVNGRELIQLLLDGMKANGVHIWEESVVGAIDYTSKKGWRIQLLDNEGGQTVKAKVLIDSAGGDSAFAKKANVEWHTLDDMVGAVLHYRLTSGHKEFALHKAYAEGVREGWWYMAPMHGRHADVVLMTDHDLLRKGMQDSGTWLHDSLKSAPILWGILQRMIPQGKPSIIALQSRVVRTYDKGYHYVPVGHTLVRNDSMAGRNGLVALASADDAFTLVRGLLEGRTVPMNEYLQKYQVWFLKSYRQALAGYQYDQRWSEAPFWARRHKMKV